MLALVIKKYKIADIKPPTKINLLKLEFWSAELTNIAEMMTMMPANITMIPHPQIGKMLSKAK